MKTINIAPNEDEIEITVNSISTKFAGGIKYTAEGLNNFKEGYLKETFSAAIAISSKAWVLEKILNNTLNLNGCVE